MKPIGGTGINEKLLLPFQADIEFPPYLIIYHQIIIQRFFILFIKIRENDLSHLKRAKKFNVSVGVEHQAAGLSRRLLHLLHIYLTPHCSLGPDHSPLHKLRSPTCNQLDKLPCYAWVDHALVSLTWILEQHSSFAKRSTVHQTIQLPNLQSTCTIRLLRAFKLYKPPYLLAQVHLKHAVHLRKAIKLRERLDLLAHFLIRLNLLVVHLQ